MRSFRKLIAAALLTAVFAPTGLARDTLKLADGTSVRGHGTRYDGDTETLYFRSEDGRDLTFTMDQLDGRSVYVVHHSVVPKDDGQRQLALANFARDAGLFAHSNRHYGYAKKADPSLAAEVERNVTIMHDKAASYCMEQALAASRKGDTRDAETWLKRILQKLPDTGQAAQASKMLDKHYAEVRAKQDDELERKAPELLASDLKRGKQAYDAMLENNKKGLQTKNNSRSRGYYERAVKDGEKALKEIDKVAKKRTDGFSQETLDGYRGLITEQVVEIRLNYASQLLVQSDYRGAQHQVNNALALDPGNEAALSLRSRVENASNSGLRWW
jgi:hypothetical protein